MHVSPKRNGRLAVVVLCVLCLILLISTAILATAFWFTGAGQGGDAVNLAKNAPKPDVCAYLRVKANPDNLLREDMAPFSEREFDIFKATQVRLVKSSFVLTSAMRGPTISKLSLVARQRDPVQWLADALEVGFPGGGEVMSVGISGHDPQESATLVNAVVDAYLKEVVDKEQSEQRQRLSELDRIYTEKEAEVRNKRNDLRALAERLGSGEADDSQVKQQILLQDMASYRGELLRTQLEASRAQARLEYQKTMLMELESPETSDADTIGWMESDATARRLFEQEASILAQLEDARAMSRNDSAKPQKLEGALAAVRTQLDARQRQLITALRSQKQAEISAAMKQTALEIQLLQQRADSLKQETDRCRKEVEQFGGSSSIDLDMMRAEIYELQNILGQVAAERQRLKIESRSSSRIILLQHAEVPEK